MRYILDGFESEEFEQSLKASDVFPLIRDICHKFGLKVICETPTSVGMAFQLCLPNGMAVGKAFTRMNDDKKLEYCYRTPYYRKERGRSDEDKETLHSTKVSSLMATLSRVKAIPSVDEMIGKKMTKLSSAREIMERAMGSAHKSTSELQADEIQALLCAFLGESPNGNHITIDTIKCKRVLDKYVEADRVAVKKLEEANRFFSNPFYMIGADQFGHFIVGKVKVVGDKQYEIVEQFKRYKDITERDDLISVMTMTKLSYEGKNHRMQNGYIPASDMYDENLDAVFFYERQATHYDYIWMATPC
jgi:D-alanine-D-alanine ligase-like ATP-grasp enzyme